MSPSLGYTSPHARIYQTFFPPPRKIAVLGAGAWGTAVAISVGHRHDVLTWGRNAEGMLQMTADRENKHYLAGASSPAGLNDTMISTRRSPTLAKTVC